jgi:hypothetical protein
MNYEQWKQLEWASVEIRVIGDSTDYVVVGVTDKGDVVLLETKLFK